MITKANPHALRVSQSRRYAKCTINRTRKQFVILIDDHSTSRLLFAKTFVERLSSDWIASQTRSHQIFYFLIPSSRCYENRFAILYVFLRDERREKLLFRFTVYGKFNATGSTIRKLCIRKYLCKQELYASLINENKMDSIKNYQLFSLKLRTIAFFPGYQTQCL